MLSGCCPCLGRKTVEAFEQAQDKKFGKPSETAKETKGLLDTYGLDEDIEDAGEDGASAGALARVRVGVPRWRGAWRRLRWRRAA